MRRPTKNCTLCKHFVLDTGWAGTDETGGDPVEIRCGIDLWDIGGMYRNENEFRDIISRGKNCEEFVWFDEEE